MASAQPPPEPKSFFVTNADLSKSRSAPEAASIFEVVAESRLTRVFGLLFYLAYLMIAWVVVSSLSDPTSAMFINLDGLGQTVDNTTLGLFYGIIACLPFFGFILVRALAAQTRTGVPLFRDLNFIRDFTQTLFLLFVAFSIFVLLSNLLDNLAESDLRINFNVLARANGVEVSEGPDPDQDLVFLQNIPVVGEWIYNIEVLEAGTNMRALLVGLINTLRVVSISLVFATMLGILLGIGLLSNNWLMRKTSSGFVEIFRNTPLLLQLFFIYRGILGFLPSRPADAIEFPGGFYLSGRGLNYPALVPTDTWTIFLICVLIGAVAGGFLWRQRLQNMERTGEPANVLFYFSGATLIGLVIGVIVAFIAGGSPVTTELPELGRFRFDGGATLSAEFLALALGLILYTSAFIADIVRAGIQSVPKGQIEAAYAHGLTRGQTLQLVVLPQALRLIIPPMTNQYLNLTKNSSLAIAIGFWDVYNVANIIQNQTGQAVALFAVLMVTYLMLSLIISLFMNTFNQSRQYRTR